MSSEIKEEKKDEKPKVEKVTKPEIDKDGAKYTTRKIKSTKYEVTKDEVSGSVCMDPFEKGTQKKCDPAYTLIWLHGHESTAM